MFYNIGYFTVSMDCCYWETQCFARIGIFTS